VEPFLYPTKGFVRRHHPVYTSYESYRPWLRDEFCFRCVYCLWREQWTGKSGIFALDHFLPQTTSPGKRTTYNNLVYSCVPCNLAKGKRRVSDPTTVLTRRNVNVRSNGTMVGRTKNAKKIISVLGLDSTEMTTFRDTVIETVALAKNASPSTYQKLMGFPAELPNLKRCKPKSNRRPRSYLKSWYELRKAGKLPATF
jgi:hypothetical protein